MGPEDLVRCVGERPGAFLIRAADVVDPGVEAPELGHGELAQLFGTIGDVGLKHGDAAAAFNDAGSGDVEIFLAPRVDDHIATRIGEPPCEATANALARTRDDSHLAVHAELIDDAHLCPPRRPLPRWFQDPSAPASGGRFCQRKCCAGARFTLAVHRCVVLPAKKLCRCALYAGRTPAGTRGGRGS